MFHICQAAHAGTLAAIKAKYNAVTQEAMSLASKTMGANPGSAPDSITPHGWFLLLILVCISGATRWGRFCMLVHRGKTIGSSKKRNLC